MTGRLQRSGHLAGEEASHSGVDSGCRACAVPVTVRVGDTSKTGSPAGNRPHASTAAGAGPGTEGGWERWVVLGGSAGPSEDPVRGGGTLGSAGGEAAPHPKPAARSLAFAVTSHACLISRTCWRLQLVFSHKGAALWSLLCGFP